MPSYATRRPVIVEVLAQRGVCVGTDAGRTRAAEGIRLSPNFSRPKLDEPYFGFREKWRRSSAFIRVHLRQKRIPLYCRWMVVRN